MQFGIFPLGFLDVPARQFRQRQRSSALFKFRILLQDLLCFLRRRIEITCVQSIHRQIAALLHATGDDRNGATLFLEGFVHVALKKIGKRQVSVPRRVRRILFYERGQFVDGFRLISY